MRAMRECDRIKREYAQMMALLHSRFSASRAVMWSLSFCDHCRRLTVLREPNEHGLDHSLQVIFWHVQAGAAPGLPRFRPVSRRVAFDGVCPHTGMVRLHNGCYVIRVQGIPQLRTCGARPRPLEMPLKAEQLTWRSSRREASPVYEEERSARATPGSCAGIDMGIRKRTACSDGTRCRPRRGSRHRSADVGRLGRALLQNCSSDQTNSALPLVSPSPRRMQRHIQEFPAWHSVFRGDTADKMELSMLRMVGKRLQYKDLKRGNCREENGI